MDQKTAKRVAMTCVADMIRNEIDSPTGNSWGLIGENESDMTKVAAALEQYWEALMYRLDKLGGRSDE